jgi:hypothetical protein
MLKEGRLHHLVVNVDGGPKIITFVVDGILNDGGDYRQFGWGRFSPNLYGINGANLLRVGPNLEGSILSIRLYDRYLTTSQAIGNYRAGL